MDNGTGNVEAAIKAGSDAAELYDRTEMLGGIPLVLTNGGQVARVPMDLLDVLAKRADHPVRKRGGSIHHRLDSFVDHVNRNKVRETAIWANVDAREVRAIYDYHGDAENTANWQSHLAIYTMPLSDEWTAWAGLAGSEMTQDAFAQLLEDRLEDLASGEGYPAPMDLRDMALSLQVNSKGTFKRKIDHTTGEASLVAKTEHAEGSTKIPRAFLLGIPVFRGGESYVVECRIRFSMPSGTPVFRFEVHNAFALLADAFEGAVKQIMVGCGHPAEDEDMTKKREGNTIVPPVFWGTPEPPSPPQVEDINFDDFDDDE